MPKYSDLTPHPLLVVPFTTSGPLFPIVMGETQPRRTTLEIEVRTLNSKGKTVIESKFILIMMTLDDLLFVN